MSTSSSVSPAHDPGRVASVCTLLAGVLRLALAVIVVVAALAGAVEVGLRAGGASPRGPAELSRAIPDGWTGFRLRPDVTGDEPFVTNDLGLHAPQTYPLAPRPGALRVAILGSSVVYGMGMSFADTIPARVERELEAAGQPAEVLNFGTHAFTVVHLSAQLQAYVHQFQPDVVVALIDLQVGFPEWPGVAPRGASPEKAVAGSGRWEALLRRGGERSALLALFDEPRRARRWVRRTTGLPLRPRTSPIPGDQPSATSPPPAVEGAPAAPVPAPASEPPPSVRAYEERRERELAAPLAAMAAFCAETSMALHLVTPYGPYFDFTDEELAGMSVQGFLEESARVHGSERAALGAEAELITRVVRRIGERGGATVIDLLEASRGASLRSSPDFTADAVHLTPAGNATLARLIAASIVRERRRGAVTAGH